MHLHDLPPDALRGSGAELQALSFPYRHSADQDAPTPVRHPVVVVGAGPVGLSLAIDLAQRGQRVVVLDNDHKLSIGSRAICFAKRALEIWDRLGVGQRMVDQGVSWNVGRVFFHEEPVYAFDLLPEEGHERPAFINLQQYYAEAALVERALALPQIDLRWHSIVTAVQPRADGAEVTVQTPDGDYALQADWLVACDGARSPLRAMLGQDTQGQVFRDRFLIADVRLPSDFVPGRTLAEGAAHLQDLAQAGAAVPSAAERWFWFDPPFHPGQSVLLHRQPDNVWRIDFQLGWDADPECEKKRENILPRVRALLGDDARFELDWASVYTFACLRMERFVHGRVVFAGDSAHCVSPFGARGANSGVQDTDNLAWKLDWVLSGRAPESLVASYDEERTYAADENLRNSTRSTDFITPKSDVSRMFRDAVLELAREHEFARKLVNSGRLSVPAVLQGSSLCTLDVDSFSATAAPGAVLPDAPVQQGDVPRWLLRCLGADFTLLWFGVPPEWTQTLHCTQVLAVGTELIDTRGLLTQRLDALPGTAYLIRPDQHVCARWRKPTAQSVQAALHKACGHVAAAETAVA